MDELQELNYDPSDPDKMQLPKGRCCGDCFHLPRCEAIFGRHEQDTRCDWSPSRFIPIKSALTTLNAPDGARRE